MTPITVTGLFVYPIKSARGIALAEARLTDRGFEHDRRFLVTNRAGAALTQRELPALALLETGIAGDDLVLRAPGMPARAAPLRPRAGAARRVRVFEASCDAISLGDDLARWLGDYLGVDCEMVYMPDDSVRPVDWAEARDGDRVGFADAYPYLLASEASLADLQGRLGEEVSMNRFRPNIVVAGAAPFAEDGWRDLTIGEVSCRVAEPCGRCQVTTIDQATGVKGKEPLATLATYRKEHGKTLFGQYLVRRGGGVIRVGDPVTIAG